MPRNARAPHIVRVERIKDIPWVTVERRLAQDGRASFGLRGLLVYFLSKPPTWEPQPGDAEANSPTEGRERIASYFAEGRRLGYVVTVQYRSTGRYAYMHTVYERPITPPFPDLVKVGSILEAEAFLDNMHRIRETGPGTPQLGKESEVRGDNTHTLKRAPDSATLAGEDDMLRDGKAVTLNGETSKATPKAGKASSATGGKKVPAGAALALTPQQTTARGMLSDLRSPAGLGRGLVANLLKENPARVVWLDTPHDQLREMIDRAALSTGNKKTALIRMLDTYTGLVAAQAPSLRGKRAATEDEANAAGALRAYDFLYGGRR